MVDRQIDFFKHGCTFKLVGSYFIVTCFDWYSQFVCFKFEFLHKSHHTLRNCTEVVIFQLLIFGFAVNLDVENSKIAWMDMDRTPESRELRDKFDASIYFQITSEPRSEEEVRSLLDHGEVVGVVRVLPGFARDLKRGKQTAVQVLVDGTNSNNASIVTGYASRIISSVGVPAGMVAPVEARSRVWFNPELKSRYYFIPGVLMNIIALITLMLTAMAIVREKEIGTMEQLLVTPIRPLELIAGKTIPFVMIGLFDVFLAAGVGMLVFHVPFRGSVFTLVGASIVFLMTTPDSRRRSLRY